MVIRARRVVLEPALPDAPDPQWDTSDTDVLRYLLEAKESLWRRETDRRKRQAFRIRWRDDTILGEAELVDIRRGEGVAELRICLFAPGSRGRGFGEEAIRALLDYARESLSLKSVYLRVYEDNGRAVACYEKCGFRRIGRLLRDRGGIQERILLMAIPLAHPAEGEARAAHVPLRTPS